LVAFQKVPENARNRHLCKTRGGGVRPGPTQRGSPPPLPGPGGPGKKGGKKIHPEKGPQKDLKKKPGPELEVGDWSVAQSGGCESVTSPPPKDTQPYALTSSAEEHVSTRPTKPNKRGNVGRSGESRDRWLGEDTPPQIHPCIQVGTFPPSPRQRAHTCGRRRRRCPSGRGVGPVLRRGAALQGGGGPAAIGDWGITGERRSEGGVGVTRSPKQGSGQPSSATPS